ncbi:MAG: hypothetical protein WC005_09080 [Candidatus Nanopelagicales bacterium]
MIPNASPLLIVAIATAVLFPVLGMLLGYSTPGDAENVRGLDQRSKWVLGSIWVLWLIAALDAMGVAIFASMWV